MEKYIEVKNLIKEFPVEKGGFRTKEIVHALNGISFDICKGETLGLVGESGCGKSTAGRCILGLIPPTSGYVKLLGENLNSKNAKDFRKKMQIIFQNPYSSLNPRMRIRQILAEPFEIHEKNLSKKEINEKILNLLEIVGMSVEAMDKFPHEFSGGQRQRIGIARALALNPEFVVADEPVSALDISIQAQILNLMQKLKKDLGLTYLFISHDLNVIRHICDRVAVMYLGEIVETGTVAELFGSPKHPYTKALLNSIPQINSGIKTAEKKLLQGDLPSPINLPSGCKFHTRCPIVQEICFSVAPEYRAFSDTQTAKCHFAGD